MPHELIMVMGVQRSGTNVLFDSLATDKTLSAFPEDIDSAFYHDFRLRPVAELHPLLENVSGRVLLKPISETAFRSLIAVAEEFRAFPLRFVWIYRDPINVLYSMHREKWIAAEEIGRPNHFLGWRKRNEYALEFQRQRPEQIVIVRYEDLCLDPAVFRQLTRCLGLNCKSYFRPDSGKGNAHVAPAVQRKIDDATGDALRALGAARTFKPRRIFRLKQRIASRLHSAAALSSPSAKADLPLARTQGQTLTPPAIPPSTIEGLYFWLRAAAFCQRNGILQAVTESGPHGMTSAKVENGPYCFLSLHRQGTLYYPHSQAGQRRSGASGTLIFGVGEDWNFFFDGRGFTVLALFRPNVPCYPPYHQERSVLFRIGPSAEMAPAFSLQWDGVANSSKAILLRSPRAEASDGGVVSSPPGTHQRQDWAVITVQHGGDAADEFSISANGAAGSSISLSFDCFPEPRPDLLLEIGGFTGERESLFYGELAELMIFRRALQPEETRSLMRYLAETHQL